MDSFSLLHREDHWDPHPRVWHRDSHDSHCRHGPGPPAHPQSAAHSSPHCKLPPQRQRQHVGRCRGLYLKVCRAICVSSHATIPSGMWFPHSVPSRLWTLGEMWGQVVHGWCLNLCQFFSVPVKVVQWKDQGFLNQSRVHIRSREGPWQLSCPPRASVSPPVAWRQY